MRRSCNKSLSSSQSCPLDGRPIVREFSDQTEVVLYESGRPSSYVFPKDQSRLTIKSKGEGGGHTAMLTLLVHDAVGRPTSMFAVFVKLPHARI